MALSTALRLGAGLLVFILLARQMGAGPFGSLMAAFALAALAAIPVNHGLSVYLLRQIPRSADAGRALLAQSFALKLGLALICLPLTLVLSLLLGADHRLVLVLFTMHACESFTELICIRFRACGQFGRETKFVSTQALFHLVFIVGIAQVASQPLQVAVAFCASRFISLLMALARLRAAEHWLPRPNLRGARQLFRDVRPFFLDFSAQTALVQLDVVLLSVLSSPVAVGVYQAGMRIVQGLSQAITIMVNVVLPRLSKRHSEAPLRPGLVIKVMAAFALAGMGIAVPLGVMAPDLAPMLFGHSFEGLPQVLELLAVFLAVRFLAAGPGVILIVLGEQRLRALTIVLAIGVLGAAGLFFMPSRGAAGAVLSMLCAYGFILVSLSALVAVRVRQAARP